MLDLALALLEVIIFGDLPLAFSEGDAYFGMFSGVFECFRMFSNDVGREGRRR